MLTLRLWFRFLLETHIRENSQKIIRIIFLLALCSWNLRETCKVILLIKADCLVILNTILVIFLFFFIMALWLIAPLSIFIYLLPFKLLSVSRHFRNILIKWVVLWLARLSWHVPSLFNRLPLGKLIWYFPLFKHNRLGIWLLIRLLIYSDRLWLVVVYVRCFLNGYINFWYFGRLDLLLCQSSFWMMHCLDQHKTCSQLLLITKHLLK